MKTPTNSFQVLITIFWLGILSTLSISTAQVQNACKKEGMSEVKKQLCAEYYWFEYRIRAIETLLKTKIETNMDLVRHRQDYEQWLTTLPEICNKADDQAACMESRLYDKYYALLETLIDETPIKFNDDLLDRETEAICEGVAELATKRTLKDLYTPFSRTDYPYNYDGKPLAHWQQLDDAGMEAFVKKTYERWGYYPMGVFNLKINNNNRRERYDLLYSSGSCSSSKLFNIPLSQDRDRGFDPLPNYNEKFRWLYWGGSDKPIIFKQRNLVVTINRGHPEMVSWIMPNARIRPLCSIRHRREQVVNTAENLHLCRRISNTANTLPTVPFNTTINYANLPFVTNDITTNNARHLANEKFDTFRTDLMQIARIDLNHDGKIDTLGYFSGESGAGCGSSPRSLRVLKEDLSGLEESTFAQLARLEGSGAGQYDQFNKSHLYRDIRIFDIDGQFYVKDQYKAYVFEGDERREVCDFGDVHEVNEIFGGIWADLGYDP